MNKLNAAKSIRNLANLYKDMAVAADVLEQLGSLDQATAEAKAAVATAQAELTSLRTQAVEAGRALDEFKEKARHVTQAADQKARATESQALEKAAAITERAEVEAATLVEEAKNRAGALEEATNEQIALLRNNVAVLKEQYATLNIDAQAKRRELAAINEQLNAARDGLRKLLG